MCVGLKKKKKERNNKAPISLIVNSSTTPLLIFGFIYLFRTVSLEVVSLSTPPSPFF